MPSLSAFLPSRRGRQCRNPLRTLEPSEPTEEPCFPPSPQLKCSSVTRPSRASREHALLASIRERRAAKPPRAERRAAHARLTAARTTRAAWPRPIGIENYATDRLRRRLTTAAEAGRTSELSPLRRRRRRNSATSAEPACSPRRRCIWMPASVEPLSQHLFVAIIGLTAEIGARLRDDAVELAPGCVVGSARARGSS